MSALGKKQNLAALKKKKKKVVKEPFLVSLDQFGLFPPFFCLMSTLILQTQNPTKATSTGPYVNH